MLSPVLIFFILLAIVLNSASVAVNIPFAVIALATKVLPSLTDFFKLVIESFKALPCRASKTKLVPVVVRLFATPLIDVPGAIVTYELILTFEPILSSLVLSAEDISP